MMTHLCPITILIALLGLASCGSSPERIPHKKIPGVDTDRTYDPNRRSSSYLRSKSPAEANFLRQFVADLVAAHREKPGVIAIFPALTRTSDQAESHVNGLGEFLMDETATNLEEEGVQEIVAGSGLQNDLLAKDSGLHELRGNEDVYVLSKKIEADYFVFGSVERKIFNRIEKDETLQINWVCKRAADRATVAAYRSKLEDGPLAEQLHRYYQTSSKWDIESITQR